MAPLGLREDSLGWVVKEGRLAWCSEFAGQVEAAALVAGLVAGVLSDR